MHFGDFDVAAQSLVLKLFFSNILQCGELKFLKFTLMRVIIKINIKLNHHPLPLFATTDGLLLYCLIYKKPKPNGLLSKDAATVLHLFIVTIYRLYK